MLHTSTVLAFCAVLASAAAVPVGNYNETTIEVNSVAHSSRDLQARAGGSIPVTFELDTDVRLYCKTAYGRSRIEEKNSIAAATSTTNLEPGEDLWKKPIHFTQVSRAFSNNGGRDKVEHECKLVGIASAPATFRFASAVENYLYPCGPNNGLTIVCGQEGLKGNHVKCDAKAFQVL